MQLRSLATPENGIRGSLFLRSRRSDRYYARLRASIKERAFPANSGSAFSVSSHAELLRLIFSTSPQPRRVSASSCASASCSAEAPAEVLLFCSALSSSIVSSAPVYIVLRLFLPLLRRSLVSCDLNTLFSKRC